jgi:hypothetical protein
MSVEVNKTRLIHRVEAGGTTFPDEGEQHQFHFLSRWSLLGGIVFLMLFVSMAMWFVPAGEANPLAEAYLELVGASQNPVLYRLAMTFDVTGWLVLGVFFTALAGAMTRRAPLRSTLIAFCGLGQIAGVIGAFTRLEGISDLASRYGLASLDQQAAVLQAYLDLQRGINAAFGAGALLWSLAFLLVASSMPKVPGWLTGIMALNGFLGLVDFGLLLTTGQYLPFEFSMLRLFLLLPVTFFGLAWVWRPRGFANDLEVAAPTLSNTSDHP